MDFHGYALMMAVLIGAIVLSSYASADDPLSNYGKRSDEVGGTSRGMSTLRFGKRASKGMAALRFGKRVATGMNTLRFGKRAPTMQLDDVDEDMMKMLLRLRALHHGKRSEHTPSEYDAHMRKLMMHMAKKGMGEPIELNEEELMKLLVQLRSLHHG